MGFSAPFFCVYDIKSLFVYSLGTILAKSPGTCQRSGG